VNDPGVQPLIEAATAYERLFVPALFGAWAPRVADAAGVRWGQRALDVACGTGVLAREVASRIGPDGRVMGVDLNPGMLEVANRLAPEIEWRQAAAESLPFPDESFDVVVSQFGLMFFADQRQAVREMLRVAVPQGRLAVAVWDTLENNPAYAAEAGLLERTAGAAAAEALRAPFVLGDPRVLAGMFEPAAAVGISTQRATAQFPSVRTLVEADLRGWLPVMGVTLAEEQIKEILQQAENVMAPFVTEEGRVVFTSSAHIVTATKP
jgi:SAM-dependent methyltransferase